MGACHHVFRLSHEGDLYFAGEQPDNAIGREEHLSQHTLPFAARQQGAYERTL